MEADVIACAELTRSFQAPAGLVPALSGVSMAVHRGEFVALVGASGSGKTTLLGLLSGLDRPDSGRVFIQGRDLSSAGEDELLALRRLAIGFVFQAAGLIPLMTAVENVAMGLEIAGAEPRRAVAAAMKALEQVGLADRARHRTYELSGGERQRVALARALVKSPAIVIADEPTGQLDSETGALIFALLRETAASGTTVLMATHDEVFAEGADRILTLVDGALVE